MRAGPTLKARFVPVCVAYMREGGISRRRVRLVLREWWTAVNANRRLLPVVAVAYAYLFSRSRGRVAGATSDPGAPLMERVIRGLVTAFVWSLPILCWSVQVGPMALTPSHALGVMLLAAAWCAWREPDRRTPREWGVVWAGGFFGIAVLSDIPVLLRPDVGVMGETLHGKAVKQLIGLLFAVLLLAALRYLIVRFNLAESVLKTHQAACAAVAALTLVQYLIAQIDVTSPLAFIPVANKTLGTTRGFYAPYGFPRVALTMVEPAWLAIYLVSGWAFWLFTLDRLPAPGLRSRRFQVSGVVMGTALFVTGLALDDGSTDSTHDVLGKYSGKFF